MTMEDSLVDQIQNDILDLSIPLASIMRKAMVLSYRISSPDFREWIERELSGYRGQACETPEYRKFRSHILIDASNGVYFYQSQPSPPLWKYPDLDRELHAAVMNESIGELESLVKMGNQQLRKPLPPESRYAISEHLGETYTCTDAWLAVPPATMPGILDSVRTRLLHFIQEIRLISSDVPAIGRAEPAKINDLFYRCVMNSGDGRSQHFEDIKGSIIATDEAKISSSSASFRGESDVTSALQDMSRAVEASSERADVTLHESISLLIRALDDSTVPKSQIVAAVEDAESKGFRGKLKEIGGFVTKKAGETAIKNAVEYVLKAAP